MVGTPIYDETEEQNGKSQLKNRCRVEVFGHAYTLRSNAEASYAKELAAMVDDRMRKLAANGKGVDLSKLAIFTALNMAHELCTLKKQVEENEAVMNRKASELIEYIEDQLDQFC